jgi:hypothetical protein
MRACPFSRRVCCAGCIQICSGCGSSIARDERDPTTGWWWADLSRVRGPRLGPFDLRSQALLAEQNWLEANWLPHSADYTTPMLAESGELGAMADWGGKLVGAVIRIAGLLHMAEHVAAKEPWEVPIQPTMMEHAITIGRYLIPHAQAAYSQMGADPVIKEAKSVLNWIRSKGLTTVTERELFEGTKGRFKRVEHLRPAVAVLDSHGYLRQQVAPARTGPGRRPSPTYEFNPHCYSHNSHNSQNDPTPFNSANTANIAKAIVPAATTFEEGTQ